MRRLGPLALVISAEVYPAFFHDLLEARTATKIIQTACCAIASSSSSRGDALSSIWRKILRWWTAELEPFDNMARNFGHDAFDLSDGVSDPDIGRRPASTARTKSLRSLGFRDRVGQRILHGPAEAISTC